MNTLLAEENPIRLIVGLGNPGRRYARTRHNIGFMVVEELARRLNASAWREEKQADAASAAYRGITIKLLKPMTFMNLSGQAVRTAAARIGAPPASSLVISDDLDLPFGRLRLRPEGSTGGHNGLRSIAAELGTQAFPRLRVGIGRPRQGDPIDWVLAQFTDTEQEDLPQIINAAVEMTSVILDHGLRVAMNRFNGRSEARLPEPAPRQETRKIVVGGHVEVERG